MTERAHYETIADVGGVKYEIVTDPSRVGLFGEPIIMACTFQEVMRPMMERATLGTYSTRAVALVRVQQEIATRGEEAPGKER